MKHKYSFLLAVALTFSMLVFVSCRSVTVRRPSGRKHVRVQGPPPHAPAHGYRHKHQDHGVELVYDSGLGVYVVVELPNHFYFKGRYYRHGETQWEIGVHVDGPWEVVAEESLPKGLRGKKGKGKPKEHPGKGRGRGLEKKN